MDNSIIYRNYISRDSTAISEIEKMCFSEPWSKTAVEEFIASGFGNALVAEACDMVIGYITFTKVFDEIAIANVAVHPNFRKKKIAESLLTMLKDFAKQNKATFITLEVRASNEPAINLYKKCQFSNVGVRKGFYKQPTEDALILNYVL